MCNELSKDININKLVYLTDKNNVYIKKINSRVKVVKLFNCFAADDRHKKGSILWLFNRGLTTLLNCIKRNKYVRKEKPDTILIQSTLVLFDSYFLKSLRKITRVVLTVHDVIAPTKSMEWSMKSLKRMYENADLLVVHSETNKKQLIEIFKIQEDKIRVIPHGVNSKFLKYDKNECRKQLNILDNKKVFLFYGGIRKSKGLDILIKALKGIDCILIISGNLPYGESFEEYRKLILKNGIRTVEYIKFTEDAFRDILFQASDYLVLPYKEFYSQSGVFMQSIQYHVPIIATDVSSFKEFINKYDIGFIAKPNDQSSLRKVILNAITIQKDYEENMNQAILENSWEVAGRLYAETLKM